MAWREKWARRLGWWDETWAEYAEQRKRAQQQGHRHFGARYVRSAAGPRLNHCVTEAPAID